MLQGARSASVSGVFYGNVNSLRLRSINQAGDNKSVKLLNNSRGRCMLDGSSVLARSGLAEKEEKGKRDVVKSAGEERLPRRLLGSAKAAILCL